MSNREFNRSVMFWTDRPDLAYEDGHSIPRRTYKCKGSTLLTKNNPNAVKQAVTHRCKLVTDHPREACLCICGHEFNRKEKQDA